MDLDMTPTFIFLGLIFISTTLGFDTFENYECRSGLIPTSILDLITRHEYLGLWIFSVSNTYEYLRNMVYGLFYLKALIIDVFFIHLHITFGKCTPIFFIT